MRIVIGGASGVGKSLVGYLSMGNNDIVVVDSDAAKLDEISAKRENDLEKKYIGMLDDTITKCTII